MRVFRETFVPWITLILQSLVRPYLFNLSLKQIEQLHLQ